MAELFQYLVVFFLAVWTARLAITKGRNGWVWGGAALILGLLPWHLVGAIPVLALMFIKSPVTIPTPQAPQLECSRCSKPHSEDQHFCTGCGWDLSRKDDYEESFEEQASPNEPNFPITIQSTAVLGRTDATEKPQIDVESLSEQEVVPKDEEGSRPDVEIQSEDLPKEYVPWGTYDVGEAPTAAVMVSRGIERFSEGKFQEAIDQFTKAIALDPNYAKAWEHRSEAYAQLGRAQQAEEDRRHLQGLDPRSSPG